MMGLGTVAVLNSPVKSEKLVENGIEDVALVSGLEGSSARIANSLLNKQKLNLRRVVKLQSAIQSYNKSPELDENGIEIPVVVPPPKTKSSLDDKNKAKIRKGKYRVGANDLQPKTYIYVPSTYLISPHFNAVDLFKLLEINTPNIIMTFPEIFECIDWNMKIPNNRWSRLLVNNAPTTKKDSRNKSVPEMDIDAISRRTSEANQFRHILKENCKRLVSSTSVACEQAGAIFRVSPSYRVSHDLKSNYEYAADWICAKETKITLIALAETNNFHPSVIEQLDKCAKADYDSLVGEGVTVDECIIDPNEFGELHESDTVTYPNPYATHMILCDNLELLEKKLSAFIPWGLM